MDKAIAENMAFLMGGTPQPSKAAASVPQFSSAGLVLSTQDEILRELEQRVRTMTQQLESIGLDVQMATVTYSPEEAGSASASNMPKCLLDCQQVASRIDRLGKQLALLRTDIEDKQKNHFFDQMVAEEIYGKLDDLRAKQQEIQLELRELCTSGLNHATAPTLASQLLELENTRHRLLSDYESAQQELEDVTDAKREIFCKEADQRYAELTSQLREHYRGLLSTLGSRYLNNSETIEANSQRLLSQANASLVDVRQLLAELQGQTNQFVELGEKLTSALKSRVNLGAVTRSTVGQIEVDLQQLRTLQKLLKDVAEFKLESVESIAAVGAQLRKIIAVMTTIWTPTSDPMSRWCDAMAKLQSAKLPVESAQWLTQTIDKLMPQCVDCATTIRKELCRVEEQNLAIDQLRHRLANDILTADQRRSDAETNRFNLNAKYEADHHQLAIQCHRASDARLNKLSTELRECKAQNRVKMDNRREDLQKNMHQLRFFINDALQLTPSKDNGVKFLNQFSVLQGVNDQITAVETELKQLRRAQSRSDRLTRKLTELKDLYARNQDVVEAIRPGSKRGTTSTIGDTSFVFNLTAEIYGVQQLDQDLIEDAATVELRIGNQARAVVVPIGEDNDVPYATLNFPKITTAAPLIINIKAGGELRGHYEMPLEGVAHNRTIDFELPETSQSIAQKGNDLEPIVTFIIKR